MAHWKHADEIDSAEVERLYVEGKLSLRTVASKLETTSQAVRKVLVAAGAEIRPQHPPRREFSQAEQQELIKRYEAGMPMGALARSVGLQFPVMAELYRSWGGEPRTVTEATRLRYKLAREGEE